MNEYLLFTCFFNLGPGGLDPVEVYEELPDDLKQCFDTKDIQMLKDTFEKYDPDEAQVWLKKCIDSGLWVPDKNAAADEEDGAELADANSEGIYEGENGDN